MSDALLAVQNISVDFGGLKAVDSVSLTVRKQDIHGIIGPNGAGKSTLLNIVCGMTHPSSGVIDFDGVEIQTLPPYKIAALGMQRTYQNINLFKNMTVRENVITGSHLITRTSLYSAVLNNKSRHEDEHIASEIADKWLEFFALTDKQHWKAGRLSYGEQRKLEIARALAASPKMLLLDEPAAGMNLTEKQQLADTILAVRDMGMTIMLVEHNMKLIMKICGEITVLDHGRLIAEGTPPQIQSNPVVIESYLGSRK